MMRAPQLSRMALVAAAWVAGWVCLVGAAAALFAPSAHAMTVADVPAIPPASVEVCASYHQTVCPLVMLAEPMSVTMAAPVDGLPPLAGHIVRFEPINGEAGAWVELARTGGQRWYPLRELTLIGGAR